MESNYQGVETWEARKRGVCGIGRQTVLPRPARRRKASGVRRNTGGWLGLKHGTVWLIKQDHSVISEQPQHLGE